MKRIFKSFPNEKHLNIWKKKPIAHRQKKNPPFFIHIYVPQFKHLKQLKGRINQAKIII